MTKPVKVVVFDLGNVLLPWNFENLCHKLFEDQAESAAFSAALRAERFGARLDVGTFYAEESARFARRYPHWEAAIQAYGPRYMEFFDAPDPSVLQLMRELKKDALSRNYGLTNFPGEFFPDAMKTFPCLNLFDGIVVSGIEQVAKPERRIFHILFDRYQIDPAEAFFVDDNEENIRAGQDVGMRGHVFRDGATLRRIFEELGLLSSQGKRSFDKEPQISHSQTSRACSL